MKKTLLVILIILVVTASLGLCACTKYKSSYSATMLICQETNNKATMDFEKITGTKVFQLKWKEDSESIIQYTGSLEKGSLKVYYDCGEGKEELFTLKAGESVELAYGGKALNGATTYIIVETDGKCEGGRLTFKLIHKEEV